MVLGHLYPRYRPGHTVEFLHTVPDIVHNTVLSRRSLEAKQGAERVHYLEELCPDSRKACVAEKLGHSRASVYVRTITD